MRREGWDGSGDAGDDLTGPQSQADLAASEQSVGGDAADIDATLGIANRVKRDFDQIAAVRAGDEALIATLADRALTSRDAMPRRRADRRVAAMLGLGLVLSASAAAAWWTVHVVTRSSAARSTEDLAPERHARVAWRGPVLNSARALPTTSPPSAASPALLVPPPRPAVPALANRVLAPGPGGSAIPPAGSTRPAAAAGSVHSLPAPRSQDHAPALAPPPPAPTDQTPAASTPGGPAAERSIAALPMRAAPPADPTIGAGSATVPPAWSGPAAASASASDLFQRANSARRAGDVQTARALYREVEERFPGSAEARLARVSLGKLLLAAGEARGAEQEFAHYLAGGSGPLVQEALVGRAESLQSLARADEERRVWQRIVDEFPSGVYAAQARRRLLELGARPRLQVR